MKQDLRYAWRLYRKSPGFTAIVILTLALGIGANSAVFSVVRGVLLQPLLYRDPGRLVDVLDASVKDPDLSKTFGTYADFEEYRRHSRTLQQVAFLTWADAGATLTGRGPARHVLAVPVSDNFFSLLGVSAALGRTFQPADLARGCPVVVSDAFWRSTLSADPRIAGQSIELDHRACTVVGVMPAGFEFYPRQTQAWMLFTPGDPRPRDRFLGIAFARLAPGVSASQAQAELAALHRRMPQPDWQREFAPAVDRLQDEFSFLAGRNLRPTLGLLMLAVGLVLLISCLNVANLLLARAAARSREFAVRAALGSGHGRLIRQVLAEGLLLAAPGGAAGVGVAFVLVRYFVHANPIELPIGSHVALNLPVLAFTALVTLATALVFSLAPAWSSAHPGAGEGLRAAGRGAIAGGHRRLTRVLIAAEMALSLSLACGAGLLMRSVLKMSAAPLGFDPGHVLAMHTNLPPARYSTPADERRFYDDIERRLNAVPGVEGSALALTVPPYGGAVSAVEIAGRPRTERRDVGVNPVSPDYFHVLRIALRRGRVFDRGDGPDSAPVAVVNETFAAEYFPASDPLGQRVRVLDPDAGEWLTVVGVTGTEKHPELLREMSWRASPGLYRPLAQAPSHTFAIAVRTYGDQADTGRAVERALGAIDPDVPAGEMESLRTSLGAYLKYPRFRALVLDQFAALALLLAAVGLHGLLAQYVTGRTRELGLRMAIGARRSDIIRLVLRQGGVPVVVGLAAGMALTAGFSHYLSSLLFEVQPLDPWTLAAAPALLVITALAAIAKPARDAAQLDPMAALREE